MRARLVRDANNQRQLHGEGKMSVLNSKVLVLNKSYFPVHVTSVRRAFSLLYQGAAKAVDHQYRTFDYHSWRALSASVKDDTVGLIGRAIRAPRVILLLSYDRVPRRRVRFSRHNVFARDNNTCQYCGARLSRSDLNLDHVIPRSQKGLSTWENIVCSCFRCNRVKGGRRPEEAGMQLVRDPIRPEWTPFMLEAFTFDKYKEWGPFLNEVDVAYLNAALSVN